MTLTACDAIATSELTWPGSISRGEGVGLTEEEGEGGRSLLFSVGLVIFEEPKVIVFWAVLAAGPFEVRARRVGGILGSDLSLVDS